MNKKMFAGGLLFGVVVGTVAIVASQPACTPQQAKTVENDVLSVADAACVVENALTLVNVDAVMAFCKIEPQLKGAVQALFGRTKARYDRPGCAQPPAGDGGK